MISAVHVGERIVIPAINEANSLYQDGYGSYLNDERLLTLKPFEALYLVENQRIALIEEENRKKLVFQELLWKLSYQDPYILTRYLVYRDLRTRGFVAREGLELGIDFLVYERGTFGRKSPKYLIFVIWEGSPESISNLMKILGISEEKNLILQLAVVDRRGEVVYYTFSESQFTLVREDLEINEDADNFQEISNNFDIFKDL